LGIIIEARLEPGPGLVVVTGETGAGKTLLVGALRLLLGQTAHNELVGPAAEESRVEGRFLLPDGAELVVARRVAKEGRSRAYLDGSMVPARTLDARTGGLVEIVGQHDQLTVTRVAEVRAMVDRRLEGEGADARRAYREAWDELIELRGDRQRLGGDRRSLERELDLVAYQSEEISRAGFALGDAPALQQRAARLRNVEELTTRVSAAHEGLLRGRDGLGEAQDHLRRAAVLDPGLSELAGEVGGAAEVAADLARRAREAFEELERDPAQLEEVEERLTLLGQLRRKYGATLEEVLAFGEKAAARAGELRGFLDRADDLGSRISRAEGRLAEEGDHLRKARRQAGAELAEAAVRHLEELGFADPVVEVEVEAGEPGPEGADRLSLRFASDRRLALGEVAKVASGGELSRLVLALRLAAGETGGQRAPVVVFDEVDAGVGGATALALGRKLATLASDRQVLCVTHLPQVAAFADTHFVVDRREVAAGVRRVDGEDRLEELTRMLAGLPDSDRGRRHAEELRRTALAERQ
ncbi:MAG: DNA repair protein RecN, partial [Acidimicrobiia bacterium]